MPRYYCDYCDTYLTHDSPSVRKQHNAGYKHKANVRTYYQQFEEQQTQSIIDQKVKEHQHMAAFQFKPMVQVMHRPGMGLPGSSPAPMLQMRPPVIHPGGPGGGYPSGPGGFRPPVAPVPGNAQPNGVYRPPPGMAPPGAPGRPPPAPNGMPPSGGGGYPQQPIVPGQSSGGGGGGGGGYGGYGGGYSQPPPGYGSQPPPRPGMSAGYGYPQPPPGSD